MLFVVLPTYNEEVRIGRLLDSIDEILYWAGLPYRVIVVDDGSTDRTGAIVRERAVELAITVKSHKQNEGLGAAIRDGLAAAAALAGPRDIIVTMDADDTHAPGLILSMTRMIWEGHDVVIASRYQPGSRIIGVPILRRFLSHAGSVFLRIFFPISGVKDFTCGYRAYRAEVLQQAIEYYGKEFLNQEGFECMVDILLKLRRMNIVFGEVPMILRYDLKEGYSKMKIVRTIVSTLRLVARRRFVG
jgi:dolichol-phosphate mannosyltransferase